MEVISWLGQNGHLAALATDNAASSASNIPADGDVNANVDDNANASMDVSVDVGARALQSDTPI